MADTRGASFQLAVPADATIYKTYIPTSADITTHAWIIDNVFGETGAAPFNFFCWFRVQLELIGTAMHSFGVHESFGISISGNDFAKVRMPRTFFRIQPLLTVTVASAPSSFPHGAALCVGFGCRQLRSASN